MLPTINYCVECIHKNSSKCLNCDMYTVDVIPTHYEPMFIGLSNRSDNHGKEREKSS